MSSRTAHLYERFYFSVPGFLNGTEEFHQLCARHLPRGGTLLEVGAGPSNNTSRFLATLGPLTGLDVSDEVSGNDALADSRTFDGRTFPFADQTFAGVVSNYVLEHVEDPSAHFQEIARVLRPGGAYVFRTPNLFHYVAGAARFLPHRAHITLSKGMRAMGAEDHDPWKTFYRANTPRAVRRLAATSGLRVIQLGLVEKEPSYGRSSPLLFFPMMWYERFVNGVAFAAAFRSNIFCVVVKPG
jgi:SAM-dependent methyltransferase